MLDLYLSGGFQHVQLTPRKNRGTLVNLLLSPLYSYYCSLEDLSSSKMVINKSGKNVMDFDNTRLVMEPSVKMFRVRKDTVENNLSTNVQAIQNLELAYEVLCQPESEQHIHPPFAYWKPVIGKLADVCPSMTSILPWTPSNKSLVFDTMVSELNQEHSITKLFKNSLIGSMLLESVGYLPNNILINLNENESVYGGRDSTGFYLDDDGRLINLKVEVDESDTCKVIVKDVPRDRPYVIARSCVGYGYGTVSQHLQIYISDIEIIKDLYNGLAINKVDCLKFAKLFDGLSSYSSKQQHEILKERLLKIVPIASDQELLVILNTSSLWNQNVIIDIQNIEWMSALANELLNIPEVQAGLTEDARAIIAEYAMSF